MISKNKITLFQHSDVLLCLIILAHVAVAYVMSLYAGGTQWLKLNGPIISYAYLAAFFSAFCLVYALIKGTITRRLIPVLNDFINLRLFRGLIVFIFIGLFLGSFSSVKVMMPEFMPFTWDVIFADIDKAIHFGDPWQYLTRLDKYHGIITLLYSGVWMVLHIALTLFICVSDFKIRTQYLYTFITTWIICGNIIPLMFMAVGPIYFERLTGSPRFAELSDRIFGLPNEMTPQGRVADMLWQSYIDKDPFIGSGISAFPSMHVAISMLMFLTACKFNKGLGALGLGFLVFTVIGSVNLAWHYAIDGYASIILVALIWMFWGRVFQTDNHAIVSSATSKVFSKKPEKGLVPAE